MTAQVEGGGVKPRIVDIRLASNDFEAREMPAVNLQLDMGKITAKLKADFKEAFDHAAMTTDMFAEMIGYGVVRVLEEMAAQSGNRGASMIMVPGPGNSSENNPPRTR